MTSLVVDASAVGAYLLPDEDSELLPGLTEALTKARLIVPAHWHFEVANLMLMSVRRQRLLESQLPDLSENIRALRIEVDPLSGPDAWDSVMRLAGAHNLTVYDAAYLAVAKRRAVPLATFDARLAAGARAEKVALFGS